MSFYSIGPAIQKAMSRMPEVPLPRTRRHAVDFGGVTSMEDPNVPFEERVAESRMPVPESMLVPLAAPVSAPAPVTTPLPVARMPEPPLPPDLALARGAKIAAMPAASAPAVPINSIKAAATDPVEAEMLARERVGNAVTRMSAPASTIVPDFDTVGSLRTPAPDLPGDFRRTSRMDPNLQRAAMIDQGVAPDVYDSLHDPGNAYPERKVVKRGGFLGTLEHIGRGALQGVALGGSSPGGMIGRALAGAIHGGVSPQSVENVDRRVFRMPEYERGAANREAMASRVAARTGFDPVSGAETPQAENLREGRDIRRMQMEGMAEDRQTRQDQRAQDSRERTARSAVIEAKRMGKPVPIAAVKGTSLEEFGGQMAPTTSRKTYTKTFTGKDGIEYGMLDSGQVEPIRTVDGQPFKSQQTGAGAGGITPYQAMTLAQREAHYSDTIARQDRKDAEVIDREARGIKGQFEAAKKAVTLATSEYARMKQIVDTAVGRGQTGGSYNGKFITQADVDAAQDRADTAQTAYDGVKQVVGEHPGLQFDESGEGVRFNSAIGAIDRSGGGGGGRRGGGGGRGSKAKGNSAPVKKIAHESDLADFAKNSFGGDTAKARQWWIDNGYTIQP